MKTKLLIYLLLFTIIVFSCAKDGDTGPQGEKGEQGIPGKNGSTILSGTANPNTSIGKEGDFYLNLKIGDLFGPKTSSGWGNPYNMKGPKGNTGNNGSSGKDGEDGTDGATILSGSNVPSIKVGKIGDFYIDIRDYTIYGPKNASGGWGNPVSLKSDEENGVYVFYINPIFNQLVSNDEDHNFHISTKNYTIPNIGSKYKNISYKLEPLESFDPRDVSIFWKPVYKITELPPYIPFGVGAGFNDCVLHIDDEINGTGDKDGNSVIKFHLKGQSLLIAGGMPMRIPNFTIMIQAYDLKKGKMISKYINDPERFLRIKN